MFEVTVEPVARAVTEATKNSRYWHWCFTGLSIDSFIARTDGTTETHTLTEHLGSAIALTDATGAIITKYTYEPYGATASTGTTSGNPHQYTGRENDGTGLYYYRARYFKPQLGRFISEDPFGLDGGMNQFAYVSGNPMQATGPDGLQQVPKPPPEPPDIRRNGGPEGHIELFGRTAFPNEEGFGNGPNTNVPWNIPLSPMNRPDYILVAGNRNGKQVCPSIPDRYKCGPLAGLIE